MAAIEGHACDEELDEETEEEQEEEGSGVCNEGEEVEDDSAGAAMRRWKRGTEEGREKEGERGGEEDREAEAAKGEREVE